MSQSVGAPAPVLAVVDGIPTTTSLEVARQFNRPHDEVLRRIRNLLAQLDADHLRNFAEMVYEADIGSGATRQFSAYRLTRDGFTLLAMGFTGKKALAFKLAYIDAFNKMEAELTKPTRPMLTMQPKIDHDLMQTAVLTAITAAAMVQREVAHAILQGGDDWKHKRWLVSFVTDSKIGNPPEVQALPFDTLVLPKTEVIDLMADISASAWLRMRHKLEQLVPTHPAKNTTNPSSNQGAAA